MITTINPSTGKPIKEYSTLSAEEIKHSIQAAHTAHLSWKHTSFKEREDLLRAAADILEQNKEAYARMMTLEMGKLTREAIAEVEKCAWVCRYYAEHASDHLSHEMISTDASKSYVHYEPLGVILAVMPWNYPFWQVFRFLAPALMAGNTTLLKHASNVPECGKAIESIIKKAGFPEDVFKFLLVSSGQVKSIVEDDLVKAVTLTGSEPAGKAVASTAAAHIKKAVLELGGSDPYIIMADANLDLAIKQCTSSRLMNCGQSCIGAKRFIVHESVYDEFIDGCIKVFESKKLGDPQDATTDLGPMARKDLRDELHKQVLDSISLGAECITGGSIPDRSGAYYPPTILANIKPGMPAYDDELFGPVAAVFKYSDIKDAIHLANDTKFGLGAGIFSEDIATAEIIARDHLRAGSCFVNAFVKSDPRLPFGGINKSGYGRELSHHGIREFTNVKTVYIA